MAVENPDNGSLLRGLRNSPRRWRIIIVRTVKQLSHERSNEMRTGRNTVLAVVFAVMALVASDASAAETGGKASLQCFMCGMDIHTDANLHVKLVFKDGVIKYVDDLGEAAKALGVHKDHVAKVIVFDHGSGKDVLSQKAVAVIGSKFKPPFQTMSPEVVLFFEKKTDAEKAIKKWGGKVGTFDDAIAAAGKADHEHGAGGDKDMGHEGESH